MGLPPSTHASSAIDPYLNLLPFSPGDIARASTCHAALTSYSLCLMSLVGFGQHFVDELMEKL